MKFSNTSKIAILTLFVLLTIAVFAYLFAGFDPFNFKKLVVSDQNYNGQVIYVDKVVLPKTGYVMISKIRFYEDSQVVFDDIFTAILEPGVHKRVEATYYSDNHGGKGLFGATIFEDTNGNGIAEPREGDNQLYINGRPVVETFYLR